MEAALRCGKRRGTGSSRTLGSPGGLRCAWFGRRGSVDDEFGGGGGQNLQGNGDDCGDFGSPRLDSFGQEMEEDVAVLLS
jgi:hypothetical protein